MTIGNAVPRRRGQEGFALIMALLALMLLTFLGLTLASMTTTELQIATNYRHSQQALYNAEAGLEYGKTLLRSMNWSLVLPAPRTGGSDSGCTNQDNATFRCWFPISTTPVLPDEPPPYSRADTHGNPSRNFENSSCDRFGGGMGYGVVLDDGGGFGPYQNVTQLPGAPALNGSFTLWVRRQYFANQADGSLSDAPAGSDATLVLTAEGTAPYAGELSATNLAKANRSVRFLEAVLSRTLSTPCGTRGGQVGGGPEGSNFSPCDPITGDSLGAITGVSSVAEATSVQ